MAFYQQMADMARDLLKPDTEGGLGQGVIEIVTTVYPEPDPDKPWEIPHPVETRELVRGAVSGIDQELIGKEMGGTVIVASDKVAICEVPSIDYEAADDLYVDGDPLKIISIQKIPAAGVTAAVKFIIRG